MSRRRSVPDVRPMTGRTAPGAARARSPLSDLLTPPSPDPAPDPAGPGTGGVFLGPSLGSTSGTAPGSSLGPAAQALAALAGAGSADRSRLTSGRPVPRGRTRSADPDGPARSEDPVELAGPVPLDDPVDADGPVPPEGSARRGRPEDRQDQPARRRPGDGGEPRYPLQRVVVVVDDGLSPFEFAIPCEVFGIDRSDEGLLRFDFAVCAPRPGPVRSELGFDLVAPHGLDALDGADLVVVPALTTDYRPPAELVAGLHRVVASGGRVASLCTGAFVLARAGLLDGRRATTHWRHSAQFRDSFPEVDLVPDVLFVEDGPVATSAGTAAGIDLCLHLVRRSHGSAVATAIARRMVVPPQRDGGQAQFVPAPVRDARDGTLAPLLDWVEAHLDEDLSVPVLAARVAMSERTFARRFRDQTGTTPHQWVLTRRVALAEHLLETADLSVEEVARRSGFGSATMLRHHFGRLRRTAPTVYRRAFGVRRDQVG